MRFDKSKVAAPAAHHDGSACEGGGCGDVEDAPFCVPADGIRCQGCRWDEGTQACYRNNCDALFTPRALRQRQRGWEVAGTPQLIISAGPERSGSTWLYNAVRLIFEHAEQPLDAYWLTEVTDTALDARGVGRPGSHHVLVKTHAWSGEWDLRRASHIFITHRDLRQVVRSYRRLGWESDLPCGYVVDHMRWREHAELDIAFEDIVARPHDLVRDLASRLGLQDKVDAGRIIAAINNLPVPSDWVDPVTQIWPSHISTLYMEERKRVAEGPPKESRGPGQQAEGEAGSPRPAAPVTPCSQPGVGHSGSGGSSGGGAGAKGHVGIQGSKVAAGEDPLKRRHPEFFELYGYE